MPDQQSDLLTRLQNDMKQALKAGERDRLGVIRMLLSDVKNIDLAPKPTTAEQAVDAYARKLRKGREEYQKLNQDAQVKQLDFEISVVEQYLPTKASAEQTEALVEQFLAAQSFTEKQVGQAMGAFMKQHGQQVDPSTANQIIRRRLAGK
jgi:hypothetical protein